MVVLVEVIDNLIKLGASKSDLHQIMLAQKQANDYLTLIEKIREIAIELGFIISSNDDYSALVGEPQWEYNKPKLKDVRDKLRKLIPER